MKENKPLLERIIEESNRQKLEQAAVEMYTLFSELCKAGFEKEDAMAILLAMMKNGNPAGNESKNEDVR